MEEQRKIFFCHITKTGGQTIEKAISERFPTFTFQHDTDYRKLPLTPSIRAYVGQVGWYTKKLIPGYPIGITMLRNPVSRLLSFYSFYQKHKHRRVVFNGLNMKLDWPIPPEQSLQKFLEHPAIRTVAWNRMTRDLGSTECILEQFGDDTLRNAQCVVNSTQNIIGIFEFFDDSCQWISETLKTQLNFGHVNKRADDAIRLTYNDLTVRERYLIGDYVEYDFDVYNLALARFPFT